MDWKVAEARRQERLETETRRASEQLRDYWVERVTTAEKDLPDFRQVAFQTETRIPENGLIDAWIKEHKNGPHVLYHLQKYPQELDRIMALPRAIDQVTELTMIALRYMQQPQSSPSPARVSGGRTGAPVARLVQPGPRPPTPVRTAPMRAADEPPDPETASMAAHEQYWGGGTSRRRR